MLNSVDLGTVTLEKLKELGYDEKLIDALEQENFEYLERGDIKVALENKEFAEAILYACINSKKVEMYQIYAKLDDKVQSQLLTDYQLSSLILINAPEVIENTPLAEDKTAILANVNENPKIVEHISDKLVNDQVFISELSEKNPEVVREMVEKYPVEKIVAANPALAKNPVFMAEAISQDINAIKYADKEMLNNYDVFREAAKNNKEVIEYAIQNSEELGLNAIEGVRDVAKDDAEKANKDLINEHVKDNENSGFKGLKEYLDEHEKEDNPAKARLINAKKVSQLKEIDPEIAKKDLKDAMLRIIAFERTLEENPNYEITPRDLKGLYSVEKLQEQLEKAGLQNDPQIQKRLEEYKEKYIGLAEKMIEQRKEQGKNISKSFVDRIETLKGKEQTQEHNAELSVSAITLTVNDKGIEKVITYDQTMSQGLQLTTEQMRQLEADLVSRNVERGNDKDVETPKRGITALREGPEQDGQDR